jgi:predicted phage tail protein
MAQPERPFNPEDWELVTRSELRRNLDEIWSYILDQEESINILGEKVAVQQADLDALAQTLSDENSDLNSAVTGIQAEITALQNQNPALDISGLQAQVDSMKTAVDSAAALVPPAPAPGPDSGKRRK